MIIRLDFQDIGLVGIKTNYESKVKNHYIRYIVDEYSIDCAIKRIRKNKWVVALDYEGDLPYLFTLKDKPSIPVIVSKEFDEISELPISLFMTTVPEWVVVAIKTPLDFCDMRLVYDLSKKYPNIRFCKGKFLRLPGCNIGCIQRNEIPVKIADSKYEYSVEGCGCAMITMNIEDVEGVDMLFKTSVEANDEEDTFIEEKEIEPKKKKSVNSIEDLFNL